MATASDRSDAGQRTAPAVTFTRSLPVRCEVDVFVAGGGPAGVAAALGARSQGASVYLAEAHSCRGGARGLSPQRVEWSNG